MDYNKILELITDKLREWMEATILILPNLVVGLLVLLIGIWLAKKVSVLSGRILDRFSDRIMLNRLFQSTIYMAFLALIIFLALTILNLDKAVTTILAGVGILSLALAFAFQDIAANFMAGILISFRRPFLVGDLIESGEIMGIVQEVNLRDTIIETFQGKHLIVPNKDIFQSSLTNHNLTTTQRVDIEVGISYGEDLLKVKEVTLKALSTLKCRTNDDLVFYFTEFGDSSINFFIGVWLNRPDWPTFLEARSEAIMKIKAAFDQNGITIPFPIRTLDFGIKGGEKLEEMKGFQK